VNQNTAHADRIRKLLLKHYDYRSNGPMSITDLIADLQHLADLEEFDWQELVDRAQYHYQEDIKEHGGKASSRKQDWTPRKRSWE